MYQRMEALADPDVSVNVEVSFMEIYNENVFDLLNPGSSKSGLKVRNHPTTGPYVEDLSRLAVTTYPQIEQLMDEGSKARTVASTNMNATSSRSHAVFTIVLTIVKASTGRSMVSKIHMVDLAGSERATATGASGQRLKEGANINKSLSTLGKVIAALAKKSDGKKNTFVPYRDSVLTWLLKESLGGNSKTIMLAALSPADINFEETLSTLRYADSAKQIKNAAVVNEDPTEKLIRELQEEVERLRTLLADKEKESVLAAAALEANAISAEAVAQAEGVSESSAVTGSDLSTANGTSVVANGGSEAGGAHNSDSLQEIRSQIAQSTKLITNLGKSWQTKLAETDALQKERTEQLSSLGLVPSSMVDANLPNLVNLNEDPLLSGSLIYYLRRGETRVGQMPKHSPGHSASSTPMSSPRYGTILLGGLGVANDHCSLIYEGGEVWLHPRTEAAPTFVNGIRLTAARKLTHGCRVIIGANHIFRFNYPEGALRRNDGDLSPTSAERAAAAAAASSTTSTSLKPIDYKFALEERAAAEIDALMANTLHFDLTSDEEKRLEKQMKEYYEQKHTEMEEINKQLEALKKSKDSVLDAIDYEQTRQELAARKTSIELELSKQKEKFASFSFKVWNEKLERQQLRETIGRVVLSVDEANAISKELNKQVHYELVLRSAYPTACPPEDLYEAGFGLYKRMIVEVRVIDLRDGRAFVWSQTAFQDLMEDIRAIYADYLTADDDEVDKFLGPVAHIRDSDSPAPNGVTDSLQTAAALPLSSSPFSIPPPEDSLRMFTHVSLRELLYLNHTAMSIPLLDNTGKVCGQLHVELDRIAGDVQENDVSKPAGTVDQLLGKELEVALRINKVTGLDLPVPSLYCAYTFWNSSSYKTEIGSLSNDTDSTTDSGATLNFFHEERFVVSDVPEEFLSYLESEPLIIELWAVHGTEGLDSEAKANTAKQNLEALRKAYAASQEDGVTFDDGSFYPPSSELSPQQEHKEDRFRMLASILIQESLTAPGAPTEYKNVMTKQEPWNNASVQFRLKKHVRAPRRIVFQTAQLKGYPISIDTCEQVTLSIQTAKATLNAQTSSPVPGSTSSSSSDAIAPAAPSTPANVITLKILSVTDDRIECEWDDATAQSLSPVISAVNSGPNTPRRRSRSSAVPIQAPIPIDFGDKNDRGSRSPARPSAAESSEPQMLLGELTFSLKLNRVAVPVQVTKSFSIKFVGAERVKTLNRTVSEAQLIEDLKMKEVLKTQEEQLALSGAHFQVTLLQYRTIVKDISVMIEEQKDLQKLVSASLLQERLLNELSLVDKLSTLLSLNTLNRSLSAATEGSEQASNDISPFVQLRHPRTKEDVMKRIDLVKQRINELSALHNRDDGTDDIHVQVTTSDVNHRMESKVCGILLKKAGKIWKPRWCVLSKLYFSVFRTEEEDETPKDILDLTNARINDTSSQRYPHSFAIVNWKNVWFFQAQNAEDFKRWMEALDPERVLRDTQATKEKSLQAKLETTAKALKESSDHIKSTSAELIEAQDTITTREDEIVVLTNEVERLQGELKDMELEIQSLMESKKTSAKPSDDDDMDPNEEEILILNNEIEELREKIVSLELELMDAKENATESTDTRDDELLLLREEVEVLRQKVIDLEESQSAAAQPAPTPAATEADSATEPASDDPRDAKILALTEELEETRLRVKELHEKVTTAEDNRETLRDEISVLVNTIERLKASMEESDAQLEEGTKDLESQLSSQRSKYEAQITDLEDEVDSHSKTIKSLKREVDQKLNEVEKLTTEVEIARKAEEDAHAQLDELRKKSSSSAETLSDAESQLSQKDRELSRKEKDLASKSEEIEALEKQVSKLREAARSASSASSAAAAEEPRVRPNRSNDRSETNDLKAAISKLKDEVKAKDDEIRSLEYEQAKAVKDATTDLKSTIDLLKFDLEQKEREFSRVSAQLTKKDQRISTLELDVEQGEEMLDELKAASAAKDKTISGKQKDIEQRDRQIHQLKQSVPQEAKGDVASAAAAAARRELLSGKETAEEDDSEKRRRESQMARLKSNNARLQSEIDQLYSSNTDLKSRLKESKRTVSTAQRESSRKDAQLASKSRQLDDLSKKVSEVESELSSAEKSAAEQRRALASKDRDIYDLESQVDEWKAKWEASKRTVEDKERAVEDKQQELEEVQNDAGDMEIELVRTERELADAQRNLQELDSICYDLQARLEKANQELSDTRDDDSKHRLTRDHKQQVTQLTQDIEARDQDLDRAEKTIRTLEKTLEKRDSKLADLEARLEASKAKVESTLSRTATESSDIANLKRDISSKDTAIERLKDEVNDLQRELKREKRRGETAAVEAAPAASSYTRKRRGEESTSDAGLDDTKGSSKNEERLKAKLDEATKTIVRLEADAARRQTQVERLERDRASQKSVLEDLEASVKSSGRSAATSAPGRSSRTDEAASKLSEELEDLKKENKKTERAHRNELAEKVNEIDRLQRRLEQSQQALRSREVRDRNAAIASHVPEPVAESEASKSRAERDAEKELFDLREKVIDLQRALRDKNSELEEASSGSKRESTQIRRIEERFDAERSEMATEKRQLQTRINKLESEVSNLQSRVSSRSSASKSDDADSTPVDWQFRAKQAEKELEELRRTARTASPIQARLPLYPDIHTKVLKGEVDMLRESTGSKSSKIRELRSKEKDLQEERAQLKSETLDLMREKSDATVVATTQARQAARLQDQVSSLEKRLDEVQRSEKSLRKQNDSLLDERVTLVLAVKKAQIEVLAATGERLAVTLPVDLMV